MRRKKSQPAGKKTAKKGALKVKDYSLEYAILDADMTRLDCFDDMNAELAAIQEKLMLQNCELEE